MEHVTKRMCLVRYQETKGLHFDRRFNDRWAYMDYHGGARSVKGSIGTPATTLEIVNVYRHIGKRGET